MREHCADAERESADAAHEGEHDAAHGDAADERSRVRKKVGGQCEDGRDVGRGRVHVDADDRARQPDGDDDERGGECTDSCRAWVGSGEDGLDVGLRGDDADDEREESGGDALGAGMSEAPCAGRERRRRCERGKTVPGGDACETKAQP